MITYLEDLINENRMSPGLYLSVEEQTEEEKKTPLVILYLKSGMGKKFR